MTVPQGHAVFAEKPVKVADAASETAATTPETVATLEPEPTQPTPSKGAEPLPVTPRDVANVPPQTVAATTLAKTAAKKPKATVAQAAPDAPQSAAATTGSRPSDQAPATAPGAAATSTAAAAGGAALNRSRPEGAADYIAIDGRRGPRSRLSRRPEFRPYPSRRRSRDDDPACRPVAGGAGQYAWGASRIRGARAIRPALTMRGLRAEMPRVRPAAEIRPTAGERPRDGRAASPRRAR